MDGKWRRGLDNRVNEERLRLVSCRLIEEQNDWRCLSADDNYDKPMNSRAGQPKVGIGTLLTNLSERE